MLHNLGKLLLVGRRLNSADVSRSSEDHVQIHTMVGSAGREETRVIPVSKVSIGPRGNTVAAPSLGLVGYGAGERLEEE